MEHFDALHSEIVVSLCLVLTHDLDEDCVQVSVMHIIPAMLTLLHLFIGTLMHEIFEWQLVCRHLLILC